MIAGAIIGNYLQYKLLRLGKSAHAFYDIAQRGVMNAISLGAEDAVIIISSSGSIRDVLSAVVLAREHLAKVIMLSNTLHNPLCELIDVLLVAPPNRKGSSTLARCNQKSALCYWWNY